MINQVAIAEMRDVLRDMLGEWIKDDGEVERLVLDIVAIAQKTFTCTDKRKGTEAAMMQGLNQVEQIKASLFQRFRVNYPWHTKAGSDILEFLMNRPAEETVDRWADWWWNDDWRRKVRKIPTLQEIYEYWPQAFSKPVFQSEENKPKAFRAGES